MTEAILAFSVFFLLKFLLIFIVAFVFIKANIIKKSAYFNCVTWNLFIFVVYFYTQLTSYELKDLGDIWLIFAVSYLLVFETSDWAPVEEIQ